MIEIRRIYMYTCIYTKRYTFKDRDANEEIFNVNSLHKYFLGNDCFQFSIFFYFKIIESHNHVFFSLDITCLSFCCFSFIIISIINKENAIFLYLNFQKKKKMKEILG